MMAVRNRRTPRREGWDYKFPGYYFVTINVKNSEIQLSEIQGEIVELTPSGEIVEEAWLDLPDHYPNVIMHQFVIMPDLFHGIIQLMEPDLEIQGMVSKPSPEGRSLTEIIRGFKTWSARRINELNQIIGIPFWQKSFHDYYIDSDKRLETIQEYIINNPLKLSLKMQDYWSPH